jgi:hypothetical protein
VRVLGGGARLLQLILSVSSNVYLYLMFYFISRCLSHITYIHIEEVWRGDGGWGGLLYFFFAR